jgi:hypothetical protein
MGLSYNVVVSEAWDYAMSLPGALSDPIYSSLVTTISQTPGIPTNQNAGATVAVFWSGPVGGSGAPYEAMALACVINLKGMGYSIHDTPVGRAATASWHAFPQWHANGMGNAVTGVASAKYAADSNYAAIHFVPGANPASETINPNSNWFTEYRALQNNPRHGLDLFFSDPSECNPNDARLQEVTSSSGAEYWILGGLLIFGAIATGGLEILGGALAGAALLFGATAATAEPTKSNYDTSYLFNAKPTLDFNSSGVAAYANYDTSYLYNSNSNYTTGYNYGSLYTPSSAYNYDTSYLYNSTSSSLYNYTTGYDYGSLYTPSSSYNYDTSYLYNSSSSSLYNYTTGYNYGSLYTPSSSYNYDTSYLYR